jgi:hypothetical protein
VAKIEAPQKPAGGLPSDSDTPEVFIADVADTLRERRNLIVSELQRKGITVHKKLPPPYDAAAHEDKVKQTLRQAKLSVHLLDDLGGNEIDGDDTNTYPRRQVELALEHAHSQFIWVPRELKLTKISDAKQKDLLNDLKNRQRDTAEFFNRDSPDRLPDLIIDKLNELQNDKQPQSEAVTNIPHSVLLDMHPKDEKFVHDLMGYLSEKRITAYLYPSEDDPGRNLEFLRDRLKRVGALVIFFGEVKGEWVHARLTEAIKIIYHENCPVRCCGVYLAPPDKDKQNRNFGPACNFILDNRNKFDPASVEPLLQSFGVGS